MKLKIIKPLVLFLAVFSLFSSGFAQTKAVKIEELIKSYTDLGGFNGSLLVSDKGNVIYKKSFGKANMEWDIPNEPDTKFRLASISKQFTAAIILQLVEQGKIKLDGKITDYLTDYRKDTGDKVTIHQLLNHTSGIPSYTSDPGFFPNVSRNPFTVTDFVKKYSSGDLEFEPGSKFSYNNSGYFLLGAIIEKTTGKSYEHAVKDGIFTPLGMKNSGYDHWETVLAKRATGYTKTADGYVTAPYLDMSLPYAAGSLYSTIEDMYLWDRALYTDKVVSAKSKELMFKPGLSNYGYGFDISESNVGSEKIQVISHSGGINGFSTLIVRLVGSQSVIILLDNTSQGKNLSDISKAITNILYNQPFETAKKPVMALLNNTVEKQGIAAAVEKYRELKAKPGSDYDISEESLNGYGYSLLRSKKIKEAIEIFKLNVEFNPKSANSYDSLGEAYLADNNKEASLANYKKAVELDPQNSNAAAAVKRLENPDAAVKVDPKVFEALTGEYPLAPTFVLTVTAEDGKLFAQATGQQKIELVPETETEYVITQVNARVTFLKDGNGVVTGLVLLQNGRKTEAEKK